MAGTGTYPDVTIATANTKRVTLHMIDASGDPHTESLNLPAATTNANIKALADGYQASSNVSIYGITVSEVFLGDEDADNAVAAYRGSVKDGINMLWKDPSTLDTVSPRLVAPIAEVMQGNQDIPLLAPGNPLETLAAAYGNILPAGYEFNQMQFTERKERSNNPVVKI